MSHRNSGQGFFIVTWVSREDLEDYLPQDEIARLTDDDMELIASNMSDAYVGGGQYWHDLAYFAQDILKTKTGH